MTRKDYVALAQAILDVRRVEASTRLTTQAAALSAVDSVVYGIARALQADNPAFDFGRFLVAAGYGTDGSTRQEDA